MKNFFSLVSRNIKAKCTLIVLIAMIDSLLESVWPVRLGALYTGITDGTIGTVHQVLQAAVIFAAVYLGAKLIKVVRRVALDCVIADNEAQIRSWSIAKLLKLPVSYYDGCLSGEKTAQLTQGIAGLSQLIKIMCNDVFSTIWLAVCTLVQVSMHAPPLMVAIILLYLGIGTLLSLLQIYSQNGIRERIIHKKTALDGQICQSIAKLEFIRCLSAEDYESKRLGPSVADISVTEKKHHRCMGFFDCLKQICKVGFFAVTLLTSACLAKRGQMNPGMVITVCMLFQQLVKPIEDVYRFMDETAASWVKARALREVAQQKQDPMFDICSRGRKVAATDAVVHIEDVTVTNPVGNLKIAQYGRVDISCTGKTALQGPNGSGKTSLVRCLTRYYPHLGGQITLLGHKQEEYSQKELTGMVFYTPQISFFIAGTVRENLQYGLSEPATDSQLADALHQVHLVGDDHGDTVIDRDPRQALDFMIGEKAEELSGGMKQRLALARAFLRTPKLFIFDEISANLDATAATTVLTNIERYAAYIGAGIMYITHDEQVVSRCDTVLQLQNELRT